MVFYSASIMSAEKGTTGSRNTDSCRALASNYFASTMNIAGFDLTHFSVVSFIAAAPPARVTPFFISIVRNTANASSRGKRQATS